VRNALSCRSTNARWREQVAKLTRELDAERAARAVAEAKLASALTQIGDYEKRLFGRTSERVVPHRA
jgi:hypothetical protein